MQGNTNAKSSSIDRRHYTKKFTGRMLLAFSIAVSATWVIHAAGLPGPSFNKVYKAVGDSAAAPAEHFEFDSILINQTADDINNTDVQSVFFGETDTSSGVDFTEGRGDTKTVYIGLPDNDRFNHTGTYTYTVWEKPGNTLGVTYDVNENKEYTLTFDVDKDSEGYFITEETVEGGKRPVVTLKDSDGTKITEINNKYEAGTLTVRKHLEGKRINSKPFPVQVTFTVPDGKEMKSDISVTTSNVYNAPGQIESGALQSGSYTVSFDMEPDGEIIFGNLPAGLMYEVNENTDEYDKVIQYTVNDAQISEHVIQSTEDVIVNVKNIGEEDMKTSAFTGGIPYMGMLAVTLFASILFVLKLKWL